MEGRRNIGGESRRAGWLQRGEKEQSRATGRPRGLARSREEVLEDWLGPERCADVFATFRPSHEGVEDLVDQVLSCFSQADAALLSRLQANWSTLFGCEIAGQCSPLSVNGGHVRIEVNNSTFLYYFQHQQHGMFLSVLNRFSHGVLTDVDFVPRGSRRWLRSRR